MKTICFSLFLLLSMGILSPAISQSSEVKKDTLLTEKLWLVNLLLNPGVSHERALTPKSTIKAHLGLYGSYSYSSAFGSAYILGPVLEIQLKNYFNIWKRSLKGKRVSFNSAEYLAASFTNYFPSVVGKNEERFNNAFDNIILAGPLIGHQRIWKYFGYYLEAGYLFPIINQQLSETGIYLNFGLLINVSRKD